MFKFNENYKCKLVNCPPQIIYALLLIFFRFICLAFDKLSKELPLCEALVPLHDVPCQPNDVIIKPLTSPQKEEKGRLHFGIAYLPTSQKLSVTEVAVGGLKLAESNITNSGRKLLFL